MTNVFFVTQVEANEVAIKMARLHGHKKGKTANSNCNGQCLSWTQSQLH